LHLRCVLALHNIKRFADVVPKENSTCSVFDDEDDRPSKKVKEVYASNGNMRDPSGVTDFPPGSIFHGLKKMNEKNQIQQQNSSPSDEQDSDTEDIDLIRPPVASDQQMEPRIDPTPVANEDSQNSEQIEDEPQLPPTSKSRRAIKKPNRFSHSDLDWETLPQ